MTTSVQHSRHTSYGDPLGHGAGQQKCCETGRPIMTDPITGSTICSCQMQAGTQAYLTRVPTLPEHIYGSLHSQYQHPQSEVAQQSYYHTGGIPGDIRTDGYKIPVPGQAPYHYDHLVASHPYSLYSHQGFDLNVARRKNATRETTGPLKAWLNSHRKNPYPTKGEKVMLAIVTRMTLTQVSTWFANARRRLKKDNIYGDTDYDSDDKQSRDNSIVSQNSFTEDDKRRLSSDTSCISDISDADVEVDEVNNRKKTAKKCVQRLFSPDTRNDILLDRIPSPEDTVTQSSCDSQLTPLHCVSPIESTDISKDLPLFSESFLHLKTSIKEKLHHGSTEVEKEKLTNTENTNKLTELQDKEITNAQTVESHFKPIVQTQKPKIWSISEILG